MICRCHGEPAYWQRDVRLKEGGRWECAVKRRERERRRYEDPLVRIPKLLQKARRERLATLTRRRAKLRGEVQIEGRHRPSLEPNT